MTREELIAALEKADGPSRELDAEIDCMARGRIRHSKLPTGYTMADQGDPTRNYVMARAGYIHRDRGPAPHYTGSIDAALALVPEGWTRAVDATAPKLGIDVCLYGPSSMGTAADVTGTHDSEAIATCIAALKADDMMAQRAGR